MKTRHITLAFALVGALCALTPSTAGAAAAKRAPADNCVLQIVGQAEDGQYETDEPRCYDSFADSLIALGAPDDIPADLTVPEAQRNGTLAALANFALGTHYENLNLTGASIIVVGGACSGGYVNLSVAWQNRVSSTANGCPVIRHWDGFSLTGANQATTYASYNLSFMNNAANSIQYSSS